MPVSKVEERLKVAINECPMKKFPRVSVILVVIIAAIFVARWLDWIGW